MVGNGWMREGTFVLSFNRFKFQCYDLFFHRAPSHDHVAHRPLHRHIRWREVSLSEVDQWHRQRGWKGIGYHYLIRLDGTVERGRPEAEIGAHCQDHNLHSIGICYVGGLDSRNRPADTRTPAQRLALRELLETLHARYPHALIVGHHLFHPQKACPCFDAAAEYADLQPK